MRTFYEQFNEWPFTYSECRVNEENEVMGEPLQDPYLFEAVVKTNYTYSRDTCVLFCAQLQTTRTCGCNSYDIELKVEGFDVCLSPADRKCSADFYSNTFQVDNYIVHNCFDKCPLECSQRILSPKLTYTKYPSFQEAFYTRFYNYKMIESLKNQNDFNNYEHLYFNLVRFNLYYDSLSYTKVEEKAAITIDTLIGKIGSHLHLFLGISILGLFEFLQLIGFLILSSLSSNVKMANIQINNSDSSMEALRKEVKVLKIDGVAKIFRKTKMAEKLCWTTLLLFSSSVCVFLYVGSITEYFKYEVTTTNRFRQDRHAQLPSISICLINPFNTDYSVTFFEHNDFKLNNDYNSLMLFLEDSVYNKTGSYMNEEQKHKFSNFDNILLSCKIGNKECNSRMFSWMWNPQYFNCYRFNPEMGINGSQNNTFKVNITKNNTYDLKMKYRK